MRFSPPSSLAGCGFTARRWKGERGKKQEKSYVPAGSSLSWQHLHLVIFSRLGRKRRGKKVFEKGKPYSSPPFRCSPAVGGRGGEGGRGSQRKEKKGRISLPSYSTHEDLSFGEEKKKRGKAREERKPFAGVLALFPLTTLQFS